MTMKDNKLNYINITYSVLQTGIYFTIFVLYVHSENESNSELNH
jgi:hypothetical protein